MWTWGDGRDLGRQGGEQERWEGDLGTGEWDLGSREEDLWRWEPEAADKGGLGHPLTQGRWKKRNPLPLTAGLFIVL